MQNTNSKYTTFRHIIFYMADGHIGSALIESTVPTHRLNPRTAKRNMTAKVRNRIVSDLKKQFGVKQLNYQLFCRMTPFDVGQQGKILNYKFKR